MKVLWVITPKNEGCGFPWYPLFYPSISLRLHGVGRFTEIHENE